MDLKNVLLTQRQPSVPNQSQNESHKEIIFPKNDEPLVSIVIPAFNNYVHIKSCLYYILKHTENINYEVVLAYSGTDSSEEIEKIIAKTENINIVKSVTMLSFSRQMNNIVKHAKGKYICIIHDYMVPKKEWLKFLLKTIQSNRVGLVGTKNSYNEKPVDGTSFFLDEKGFIKECIFGEDLLFDSDEEKEVDYCPCNAILLEKAVWDKLGGLDNKFSHDDYYPYADLSYAIKYKLNLKTIYQPKAQIVNLHKQSFTYNLNNRIPFYLKWKNNIEKKNNNGININVCFTLTDNYCIFTACTMASILINSDLNDQYHFYLLSDYLSDKNREIFYKLKAIRDFDISFLNLDNDEFKGYKVSHWGPYIYYRFKIFDLIEQDKVLYLDSDILIKGDLHELFEIDLSNYLAAGATNSDIPDNKIIDENNIYINSGVILFNLEKCKAQGISEKLFDLAKNIPEEFMYPDQDIFNHVLKSKIKMLNIKWNYLYPLYSDYNERKDFYDNELANCVIRHYVSPDKPWKEDSNVVDKGDYLEYLMFVLSILKS